jgi:hypothetical protein
MALRSFKLDDATDQWLRKEAEKRDMSVSAFIRVCLERVKKGTK